MTKQNELEPPAPGASIFSRSRFKGIEYSRERWFAIWDMGDVLHPKEAPEIWVGYEYWDEESRDKANTRIRFLCGLLNGLRRVEELIDIV